MSGLELLQEVVGARMSCGKVITSVDQLGDYFDIPFPTDYFATEEHNEFDYLLNYREV